MTDETILEILSRHLDGDLNADEEVALSARLDAEPALANELETMRRIRRSVAALAFCFVGADFSKVRFGASRQLAHGVRAGVCGRVDVVELGTAVSGQSHHLDQWFCAG